MMKRSIKTVLAATLGLALSIPAFADVTVIVNPASGQGAMSADQVSSVFLGKTSALPSGKTAAPVDQSGATGSEFAQKVLGKTPSQVHSFWAKQMFTGRGTPPKKLGSDAAVVNFVKGHPGGIGYISGDSAPAGVKAVGTFK